MMLKRIKNEKTKMQEENNAIPELMTEKQALSSV